MKFDTISARDLYKYKNSLRYILIDVRSADEYRQGHIPGAVNLPYETMTLPLPGIDLWKTCVLYCDRGATSLLAARKLFDYGYNVLSVIGGLAAYDGPVETG